MTTVTFPCRQCGAKLEFAPGAQALACPYCGATNAVPQAAPEAAAAAVQELDLQAWLARAAGDAPQLERQTVKCPRCGAETQLGDGVVADRCAFCAGPLIAGAAYAKRAIRPAAIVPFAVAEADARARFRAWLGGLWFAPNALRRAARAESGLRGCYLPFWTFDAATHTPYTGERGVHFQEVERYVENGQVRTRTRTRVEWYPAAGAVDLAFDDWLERATGALPPAQLDALRPWRLGALKPYRDEFVAGFVVLAYAIPLGDAFASARAGMEREIERAVRADIGGDEQRVFRMAPSYRDVRFKHVLLPVWMSSYGYGGRTWRFLVNGQTGEVQGERPYSAWKIAGALALVLAALALVLWLASNALS